ncbi:MAG: hypothetical protein KatS3mg081_2310 [Gemmatimonadales bacterium]|nr:hypothetical protein HRbin33_00936 [bacterium HR33]GIW52955.1 MAG: hypothetical protein KatS3mg081_2310 [Gemmatimonadales bacterium]
MLVDLVPEFLAVLEARNPTEAYRRYLESHRPVLEAYWHNYILDLDSPHAEDVIGRALAADRRDLQALLQCVDIKSLAEEAVRRCEDAFEPDCPFDVYLMVGVGGANAGELVVAGRGIAFVCLEHFTGRPNPETYGLGLSPKLMQLWIAHEVAHVVRYTSPASRSEMARLVEQAGGSYDYWETGSRATLRELLVNEGLAVAASRAAIPGFEPWDYLGYTRRQYRRLRELDAFLRRVTEPELELTGLGYRLRYLAGGATPAARLVGGRVIPERAGYYLGLRMVEPAVSELGIAAALRASAGELREVEERAGGAQTA